jgi:hypothetical protein
MIDVMYNNVSHYMKSTVVVEAFVHIHNCHKENKMEKVTR